MLQPINLNAQFEPEHAGMRLDQALATVFSQYSRSRIKTWIEDGHVTLNDNVVSQPRYRVLGEEVVNITTEIEVESPHQAEDIPLDIVYEDEYLMVINKPINLVVHPGAGNRQGTLLNALLHYCPALELVPRAGIIHRLDKDTSGLMIVAKTIEAQTKLVAMLQKRKITREYEAIVYGIITTGGMVEQPIGRHPQKRTQMAVHPMGKPALTHYRVIENYRSYTRLRLRLATGRTHQIRVHMAYIAHPLLGDPVYAGRAKLPKHASEEFKEFLQQFKRQALHATMLKFIHPITQEEVSWQVDPPADYQQLVKLLKIDASENADEILFR